MSATTGSNCPMKNYGKLQKKLAKEKNRINFLVRCKNLQITPHFLKIKSKDNILHSNKLKTKYSNILSIFYLQCLNLCISDAYSQRKKLESEIRKNEQKLKTIYDQTTLNNFFQQVSKKTETIFLNTRKNILKK